MAKRKYRSEIAKPSTRGVRGMHRLGLVDKKTMRDFDLRCLTTVEEWHRTTSALCGNARA